MSALLLIDDDIELCELLASWLTQEGFQVSACHDGSSARLALATQAPDAVVLDVMLPDGSDLVAPRRIKLSCAETAELPLILPTGIHGLRRRISAEFEQRNLTTHIVAEIDSLSLLMTCVRDGMGATIKPMSAALLEGKMREHWRTLAFSDADMKRPNYLFSVVADRLTPAAAAVRAELRETVKDLVTGGDWRGVNLI